MPNPKKVRTPCLVCTKEPARAGYKYCSNKCQQDYQYLSFVERWKKGKEKGLNSIGLVSRYVKRYLREKYGNKCCVCGWAKQNRKTKIIPLVADHINGNWKDNQETNLRLICPNCDAIGDTFAALNSGNGRPNRRISNRAKDAKFFV